MGCMSIAVDNRQVVLLKSLRTKNRFYALVPAESGMRNADTVEDFPPGLALGIAYPCLEDGLNDFAVIRTTFETIDCYPDDQELRSELMAIVDDARGNLVRRLKELRDLISSGQAHFLGTDMREFRDHVVHMTTKGSIRRTLDSMMKVDVFDSVAKADSVAGAPLEPMYHYEFLPQHALQTIHALPPRQFISRVFDDVLDSVLNDDNYTGKNTFDRLVFQKFIAVMFVNYATTDPMFYGTSREDYGVSSDRDMQGTPLYQAVKAALLNVEAGGDAVLNQPPRVEPASSPSASVPETRPGEDLDALLAEPVTPELLFGGFSQAGHTVEIPFGAAERMLLKPLNRLADAIRLLKAVDHPRAGDVREIAASAGQEMFRNLQELNIISPLVSDPIQDAMRE
jgi:hypothetical protein